MEAVVAIFLGVIGSILAAELYVWLPVLAEKLLRYHASKLPPELSARFLEEWQAALIDMPGYITKFIVALDLIRACPRIKHEFYFPYIPYRSEFSFRIADILISSFLIIWLVPLLGLLVLIIRLNNSGPILSTQTRWGQGGRKFKRWKFRTWYVKDRDSAEVPDISFTRFGRVLRRASLDELPLLVNVLKGDMTLCGPRPLGVRAFDPKKHEWVQVDTIPGFSTRLHIKPGMLSLAAIYAPAHNISLKHEFKYDRLYIKRRSTWLNLRLMILSVCVVVLGENIRPKTRRKVRRIVKCVKTFF
jgi:lipopolysaccharide/colanic/teichoic acid biosynthesis glycosyltransferase